MEELKTEMTPKEALDILTQFYWHIQSNTLLSRKNGKTTMLNEKLKKEQTALDVLQEVINQTKTPTLEEVKNDWHNKIDAMTTRPNLVGVLFIKEVLEIVIKDPNLVYTAFLKKVFIEISKKHNISYECFYRDILYARQFFNIPAHIKGQQAFIYYLYKTAANINN